MKHKQYSVFEGDRLVAAGDRAAVFAAAKRRFKEYSAASFLFFDDETGKQVDFDLHMDYEALADETETAKSGPGRPSLGVVSKEVTLLPRHWEWLERQQSNISATLRRLVEQAMKNETPEARLQKRIEAVDRELWVLAGNKRGAEEASRMLYAKQLDRFHEILQAWPNDISRHLIDMLDMPEQSV